MRIFWLHIIVIGLGLSGMLTQSAHADEGPISGGRANLALSVSVSECFNWLLGRKEVTDFEHEAFGDISAMRTMDGSNKYLHVMYEREADMRTFPSNSVTLLADEMFCEVSSPYEGADGDAVTAWEEQFEEVLAGDAEFFEFAMERDFAIYEFSDQSTPDGKLRASAIELDGRSIGWVLLYPDFDANGVDRVTKESVEKTGIRIVVEREPESAS